MGNCLYKISKYSHPVSMYFSCMDKRQKKRFFRTVRFTHSQSRLRYQVLSVFFSKQGISSEW